MNNNIDVSVTSDDLDTRFTRTAEKWRPVFYKLAWLGFSYPTVKTVEEITSGEFTRGMQETASKLNFEVPDRSLSKAKSFSEEATEFNLEKMENEYVRLFISDTGGPSVYPHASYYLDGEVMGKSVQAIVDEYSSTGFSKSSRYSGQPDHISVLLEYMFKLSLNIDNGFLEEQARFYDEYVMPWHGEFTEKVIRETDNEFYKLLATWTEHGLKTDRKILKKLLNDSLESGPEGV